MSKFKRKPVMRPYGSFAWVNLETGEVGIAGIQTRNATLVAFIAPVEDVPGALVFRTEGYWEMVGNRNSLAGRTYTPPDTQVFRVMSERTDARGGHGEDKCWNVEPVIGWSLGREAK